MTDSGTEDAPPLDALQPPEMARRAEEIGVKKASMDALGTLLVCVVSSFVYLRPRAGA